MSAVEAVSLVVPLRNEADTILPLWRSIERQSVPADEVVLVDAGSTDTTTQVLDELARVNDRVRVVHAGPATPGRARNVGIEAAAHDWIAMTDGGIELDTDWLRELRRAAERDPAVRVVYGHYEPMRRGFLEHCAALAYVPLPRETPAGQMRAPSTASALIHRSAWKLVGGFPDLRSGEDGIFMTAVEAHDVPTAWVPDAIAHWALPANLTEIWQRFRTYSKSGALAGLQRDWQYGVARQYGAAVPFVVLALIHRPRWAAVPVAGALARVSLSIWRRRDGRDLLWAMNPAQFLGVAAVMVTADAAMFVGWADASLGR